MLRRELIRGGLGAALALRLSAKGRIGRARISAISDEIATTPSDAIAFAKKYRMEWLELRGVPGEKASYFFLSPDELKPHARAFADNGIQISFLNTNLLKFGLPGTEPVSRKKESPEARPKRLEREQARFDARMDDLRKCMASARALGCKKLRVFAFERVEDPMAVLPRVAEILDPMIRAAADEGMLLLVENEASCNVGKCSESAALLKMLPARAFGTNWDAMNGATLGEKPFPDGYALLPKDRIQNVQIKGKTLLEPEHRLDWAAILDALDRDGYSGQVGLETHYGHGELNLQKSQESMQAIMKLVGASS